MIRFLWRLHTKIFGEVIDEESYLCLGAAIWMLDQIWEEHEMQELCDLLPEECDYVDIPDVYDTRFSDEIIEGMLWAVQNRYELYKQYGCERYVEMLHIINEAWKGNVDSYLAGVIRGVARFISVYEGEYSRERLVQQLAQKDTGSSTNRHMR